MSTMISEPSIGWTARADGPSPAQRRIEELGRIIMAYSEVTEKLQDSQERLKRTVERLRDELSQKNKLLERKNRLAALGEMAAGMAHEIRNPLGGIQLYASLLAKDLSDRPQSLGVVQKIAGGVRRLESLVSQVLQFTREIRAQIVEADLAEVVRQALDMARPRTEARAVEVAVCGPPHRPARVDPLLMGQAVLNLVLNAADAVGLPGGRIEVGYGSPTGDSQLAIWVRDNGPGIPAPIMDRIFNPFFTTKENGTGLGLAIVHRIVEAHDGSITVSNADGGGARFEIRIQDHGANTDR